MLQIRRLDASDGSVLQEIRLRALLDSPSAYGSSFEREFEFDDDEWRQRLSKSDAATFACQQDDGVAVGLVTSLINENSVEIAWLVSMWVDPNARGKGVAGRLINEVIAWSKLKNCRTIHLDVTEGNYRAERTYEKRGFQRTGAILLRERDNAIEIEMELILD